MIGLRANLALRHVSAQLLAALLHVLDFRAVVGRTIERRVVQFFVGNRNAEARTEHAQFVVVQLLLLVGDVLAFAGFAQSVALDGLRQNDGRRAGVIDRRFIRGVDLDRIVSAQPHACKLLVGKMLDHLQQARIGAKEVLAEVRAALDEVFLILTVGDFAHALDQQAVAVVLDQAVPIAAPDDFDHVPAGAAEDGFQFLDDLAVAAHRTVESLQVAVDDEDQVVEFFARGQRDRAQRFGLVHFAVAEECPDFAAGRFLQAAIFQILDEARVVDRLDRAQSHRDGRELPEVRHQPRVRIRRQAAACFQFAAEILQLLLRHAAFEIGAGIDARRGVSLEVDDVAVAVFGAGAKKMIEGNFVERGGRGEGRNVAADAFLNLVGPHHHGQRVPAHQALDAAFHFLAARKGRLLPRSNRVLVRRGRRKRQVDSGLAARMQRERLQQASSAVRPAPGKYVVERIQPLSGFKDF